MRALLPEEDTEIGFAERSPEVLERSVRSLAQRYRLEAEHGDPFDRPFAAAAAIECELFADELRDYITSELQAGADAATCLPHTANADTRS